MRLRKRHLLLAVVIGVCAAASQALAVPQALAAPSELKLEVNENCVEPNWPCWASPGSSQPAAKVTIASGGSVAFVDHGREANIAWTGSAPTCEPSVPVAPAAPKTGWEGKCTFATAGTYRFESSTMFKDAYEDYTKYEVVVEAPTTPPPPGPSGEGGSAPGGSGSAPAPVGEAPSGSPLAGAPTIRSSQRGATVRGSLPISQAGAGDRLEVDLLASAASLAKAKHATRLVGRFVSASASAGRVSFAIKLDARARRSLRRHRRLALTVRIALTPRYGPPVVLTRSVTLHA